VYVGNIPPDTSVDEIRDTFKGFGRVRASCVLRIFFHNSVPHNSIDEIRDACKGFGRVGMTLLPLPARCTVAALVRLAVPPVS
jgi:RNA recognition motif-containing protein